MINPRSVVNDSNVQAFLHLLRYRETGDNADDYTQISGGGHFDSFDRHPWHGIPTTQGAKACGAYQFLGTTWAGIAEKYAIPDFTPASQDLGAVCDIAERGALDDVLQGKFTSAVAKLRKEWVSLPGGSESSSGWTMAKALDYYVSKGGKIEGETQPAAPIEEQSTVATTEGGSMGALMFLPAILQMVPALIGLFGKGERAQTNEKAAQLVVDTFTKAVPGAVNAQQAVEMAQADPAVKAAAAQAVLTDPVIEQMLSIGPTGIKEAREANLAVVQSATTWWKLLFNPVLIVTLLVLPLVYMFTYGLVFGKTEETLLSKVSADVVAQTMGTVIGLVLGGIMGFWMGQTYNQSNRRQTDQPTVGESK